MTVNQMPTPAPPSLNVYRLDIEFCEHVFFSSREVSELFQTEPVIGNYALTYALGLAQSPYHIPADPKTGKQRVRYKEDLTPLNKRNIYVTPATLLGEPAFALTEFNAQPDTYWFAFGNNAIITRNDTQRAVKEANRWRIVETDTGKGPLVAPSNFPQHGRIKMLARGNRAHAYVLCAVPLPESLPSYIRLGKFNSKAYVHISHQFVKPEWLDGQRVSRYLNPADLPASVSLGVYDLLSIHPAPLIHRAEISGWMVRAHDDVWLPAGMRFGVERLP